MTIRDMQTLIDRMAGSSNAELARHAGTLKGPRTRGSTSQKGLDSVPGDCEGQEFQPPNGAGIPGCRYLRFYTPDIGGRLGAVPLSLALEREWAVRLRSGKHGYELFVDRCPSEAAMPETSTLTVILGPDETGTLPEVVWTWHPGEPLSSLKGPVSDSTAVKTHNG